VGEPSPTHVALEPSQAYSPNHTQANDGIYIKGKPGVWKAVDEEAPGSTYVARSAICVPNHCVPNQNSYACRVNNNRAQLALHAPHIPEISVLRHI
jgi:hypothetical protein